MINSSKESSMFLMVSLALIVIVNLTFQFTGAFYQILVLLYVLSLYLVSQRFRLKPSDIFLIFFSLVMYSYYFEFTSPLMGPDEIKYYESAQKLYNNGLVSFISIDFILNNRIEIILAKVIEVIGSIYTLLFYLTGNTSPEMAGILNIFLLYLTSKEIKSVFGVDVEKVLIFVSPYFIMWSNVFFKDILSLYLSFLCLSLILNKKYVLFFLALCVSTIVRIYSLSLIISLYLLYRNELRVTILCSLAAIIVASISFPLLINKYILLYLYSFVSPSPLSIDNITDPQLLPIILENLLFNLTFFFFSLKIIIKGKSKVFFNIILSISVYITTLYMVDTRLGLVRGLDITVFAENIVRKKMAVYAYLIISIHIIYKELKRLEFSK